MTDTSPTIRPIAAPVAGVALSLRDVHKEFDHGVRAVERVSLEIAAGEFVAILGPSGCGKSTLLRMIAGLDTPTSGDIHRQSLHASSRALETAYVFQDANLLPWRSVLRNVALPLELRGMSRQDRTNQAIEALAQVGLSDFLHRYPAQLSGGMRMRVSLARALVTSPDLLLLDEPFAALDEITRAHLDEQLRELWLRRQMTVLFVTHSITEAAFLADRAVVLSKRPARVVLDSPIELPRERRNALRGEADFASHTRVLLQALEKGGA
jgi:NitT/TauT family transport system ATP-binding protein